MPLSPPYFRHNISRDYRLSKGAIMRVVLLFVFSLIAILSFTSLGDSVPSNAEPATNAAETGATEAPAGQFIQDIGNRAIAAMANTSLSHDQRMKDYRKILQDSFDFETIGHFVLGRAWATATPDQQKTFMQLFQDIVLQTYGDRLNFYSGEKFQVKGVRQENDRDSMVSSEITHPDGSKPTTIDWRVRTKDGKPMVIDVVIEGISQSVTQRQEYAAIIQRNNGNIQGLLNAMQQHLQQPSAQQQ